MATPLNDGRFQVSLTIEDSSVYADARETGMLSTNGAPVFRTFRSTNTLVLRDGQSRQVTTATDRVSGEVIRAEVTLTVVK
jgi:hypothetical protein